MEKRDWMKRGNEFRAADGDDVLFMPGLEAAFVGLGTQFSNMVAIYDRDKIIDILMTQDRMSADDAEEWIDFNIEGAWVGPNTPVLLRTTKLSVDEVQEIMREGVARADTPVDEPSQSAVQEAYIELLERDRARLNWLEKNSPSVNHAGNGFVFVRVGDTFSGGLTLREAIDSAMESES